MTELIALIEAQRIGTVRADRYGRLSFSYEEEWVRSGHGHSLSMSLPLGEVIYPHRPLFAFLWNLLPENPAVLQRWAQQYHVSAANPFRLLTHVGADVPGAAQFVAPDQLEEIQSAKKPAIEWMSEDDLAVRLRELTADATAVRRPGDRGKMSLPGAQAKTAFYCDEKTRRWGVPSGRAPTTHIIKPCIPGYAGLVENEHLCQDIAARLGMRAARSRVLALDATYIVVERYDRLPPADGSAFVRRIHQEDMCQALGLMPARKYQEDGGPAIQRIVALIRRVSSDAEQDVEHFLRANIFNWLIGGTDAHAKNYSFLITAGDQIRLAPLYDLSSQLPYRDLIPQRISMKIGDHYDIDLIGRTDWRMLAGQCGVAEDQVVSLIMKTAESLPDHIVDARAQALKDGLARSVIVPLSDLLIAHGADRLAALCGPRSTGQRRGKRKRSFS